MRSTNLDGTLILSIRAIDVYVFAGTSGELASAFVQCDCFELEFFVDIDGLEDMVGTVEDDERIAGDVGLVYGRQSYSNTQGCKLKSYNDQKVVPCPMRDSLQLRLRPSRKNTAH